MGNLGGGAVFLFLSDQQENKGHVLALTFFDVPFEYIEPRYEA